MVRAVTRSDSSSNSDWAGCKEWFPQVPRTIGLNAGFYRGEVISFTALAAWPENGGPIPGHAAFGAQLAVQVASVQGPAGGSFAFWEGDTWLPAPRVPLLSDVHRGAADGEKLPCPRRETRRKMCVKTHDQSFTCWCEGLVQKTNQQKRLNK